MIDKIQSAGLRCRKEVRRMPELPRIPERTEGAKAVILEGLEDILPKAHIDKAWEMIEKR